MRAEGRGMRDEFYLQPDFAFTTISKIMTKTANGIKTGKPNKLINPIGLELTKPKRVRNKTNEKVNSL